MQQVDRIIGGLLVGIGLFQWIATPIFFRQFEEPAAWFFNGGITLIFLGAFNLLRIRYGSVASGLKQVCIAANLTLLTFWLVMAIGLWYKFLRYPAAFGVIVVITGATVFSVIPSRRRPTTSDQTNNFLKVRLHLSRANLNLSFLYQENVGSWDDLCYTTIRHTQAITPFLKADLFLNPSPLP